MLSLILNSAPSATTSDLPVWEVLLFGGSGIFVMQAFIKQGNKVRDRWRKTSPAVVDKEELAEIKLEVAANRKDVKVAQVGVANLNEWLMGSIDPFTGERRPDGFKTEWPEFKSKVNEYQVEMRRAVEEIASSIGKIGDKS